MMNSKKKARVKTYPRIHMTLVDLAGVTFRRFGGAGFSVDTLPALVEASPSFDNRNVFCGNLVNRDRADALRYLDSLSSALHSRFHVHLKRIPPQHIGLGSKTTILLGMGIACNSLVSEPLSDSTLVEISGRGGASGIGVNAVFRGGFVADGGHLRLQEGEFVPSSAAKPRAIPPALVRLPFPDNWLVHLFFPASGLSYSGGKEVQFFRDNTPIPDTEVFRVMAAVYHGIAPAIAQADHSLLKKAILEIHGTGFKRREVRAQSPAIADILDALNRDERLVAGMSSMGPLIYAIELKEGDLERSGNIRMLRRL